MRIDDVPNDVLGKMCKNLLKTLLKDEITNDDLKNPAVATACSLLLIDYVMSNSQDSSKTFEFNNIYGMNNQILGDWRIIVEKLGKKNESNK